MISLHYSQLSNVLFRRATHRLV